MKNPEKETAVGAALACVLAGDIPLQISDSEVKPRINMALFPLVPGNMKISEFETLTCEVFDLVMKARER